MRRPILPRGNLLLAPDPAECSTIMNCPKCNMALSMTDRQGVEMDFCPPCRGVWSRLGELDKIIERAGLAIAPPPAAHAHMTFPG